MLMPTEQKSSPEFDEYADTYAELLSDPARTRFARDPLHFHRRKWVVMQRLLRRFGVDADTQRWLDVGCGQGELLALAGVNFREAVGCDPSARMLSSGSHCIMREQSSPVELPFEDGSFDFLTAVCVYHHVHGTARTLLTNEIRRVLAPGGLCCIIEHNPLNPITRAIVRRCAVDVDAELLPASKTVEMLKTSGFEFLITEYFLYLPENLFAFFRPVERALSRVPLGGQYLSLARSPASGSE
jgi:SAM-dependent methyltransferase